MIEGARDRDQDLLKVGITPKRGVRESEIRNLSIGIEGGRGQDLLMASIRIERGQGQDLLMASITEEAGGPPEIQMKLD